MTGAGGLLGCQFAVALAQAGADIVVMDLDAGAAESTLAELAVVAPGNHVSAVGDITDEEWVVPSIGSVGSAGPIDVLVNSAAIDPKTSTPAGLPTQGFVDYPVDLWRRSLEVNLTGMFLVTREVCRVMERQGPAGLGAIVNVSSTYGLVGPDQRLYLDPGAAPASSKPLDYPTTKAGVLGFTRALAAYYRGSQIRVNALVPGGAWAGHDPRFVADYASRTILGRMAEPHEYRGPVTFLSCDASSYMTGATLVVDGGWTAL